MTFRKSLLTFHLWLGLATAPFLAILGLTGAVMAYEDALGDMLNARLTRVTPVGAPRSIETMVSGLGAPYDGATLVAASLPRDGALAYQLTVRTAAAPTPTRLYVDPYSGRVLGSAADERKALQTIHQLHLRLLTGDVGAAVVSWVAVALVFLAIGGIVLWWPGKIARVHWSRSGRRATLELHNALGVYSFLFLLVFAVTAVVIHWNEQSQRVLVALSGPVDARPIPSKAPSCVAATPIAPDRLIDAAVATHPEARPSSLTMPATPDGLARVTMRFPEDRTPNGRTIVLVEPCTGRVAWTQDTRTVAMSYKLPRVLNRELHTGDLFGWPHRLLAALFSLALPVMAITGPLIWWRRRVNARPIRRTA
jgi:uncharacterized iron-regulated membrane protein